jgi:hypothetical protein
MAAGAIATEVLMRAAHWRAAAGLVFSLAVTASGRAATPADAPGPAVAAIEDKLAALNTLARAHYATAKASTLAAISPVIVVEPEALTLVRADAVQREVYVPQRYRDLKALSHMALGLY